MNTSTPTTVTITGNAYPAFLGGRPRARYENAMKTRAKVHFAKWTERDQHEAKAA